MPERRPGRWRRRAPLVLGALAVAGGASVFLGSRPAVVHRDAGAAATPAPGDRVATVTAYRRIAFAPGRLPVLPMGNGAGQPVRSVFEIGRQMGFGDFVWDDSGVPPGPAWVRVDLDRQLLSVFRGGHEIGTAVILFGANDKPTPRGLFPVLEKARAHHSRVYDADMPFMLRLTADGVALHASAVRRAAATHGCIGTPPAFARRLFELLQPGDPVTIVGSAAEGADTHRGTGLPRG
ncbi:MAG: L,D-transpeptidase family protein [Sphingomonadales bacterium]|nr:L,D-transpeptidase family protein [Sphingomonadales bacterium]